MIERAVFEVPSTYGTVSDVRIAGEPIRYGGQLAERMTVKLIGLAAIGANFSNSPARFPLDAYIEPANPEMVTAVEHGDSLAPRRCFGVRLPRIGHRHTRTSPRQVPH